MSIRKTLIFSLAKPEAILGFRKKPKYTVSVPWSSRDLAGIDNLNPPQSKSP